MKKRGIFFSLDSLVGIAIIVIIAIFVFTSFYTVKKETTSLNFISKDLVKSLASLTIKDINNSYVNELILSGKITNLDYTVIEQVGQFWALGMYDEARKLIQNVTYGLIPAQYGYGVYINDLEVFSQTNIGNTSTEVVTSKHFISGIEFGHNFTSGKTSRAFLKGINELATTSYIYYGGYIGDGNISSLLILPNIKNVTSIYLELNPGSRFTLFINGNASGYFTKTAGYFNASTYNISEIYFNNLKKGENNISIVFNETTSNFIGGGYLRVKYVTDEIPNEFNTSYKKEYLHGIEGLINEYTSFYVPGNLLNLNFSIHYLSPFTIFLNIGNITVWENASSTETRVVITNSTIGSKINYKNLDQKTIPLRLGIRNASYLFSNNADVILITDFSGSMKKSVSDDTDQGNANINCNNVSLYPNARKSELAKCLDKEFVDIIMSFPGNRVWPVFIYSNEIQSYTGNPNNANQIKSFIDSYGQGKDFTCLACSLNKAYEILQNQSFSNRTKFIVLMTDGIPTHCANDSTNSCRSNSSIYSSIQSCLGYCDFQGLGQQCQFEGCNDNLCQNPVDNTLYSANRTRLDLGATTFTVGFGQVSSTCNNAIQLLKEVANITNGNYSGSNNSAALEVIYKDLAYRIVNLSFSSQLLNVSGNFTNSILYPDSYMEFNYNPIISQSNIIPITIESDIFNNNLSYGYFKVPDGINVTDAKVTSYSEEKWTEKVYLNNNLSYNLKDYNVIYTDLGDPYIVQLPLKYIMFGNNLVNVTTGIPDKSNGGSHSNKVIYTLGLNLFVNYSGVFASAKGCSWFIEFEDSTNTTLKIPQAYSGPFNCYYTNSKHDLQSSLGPAIDDSMANSVFLLFKQLDPNDNGKLDVKFNINQINLDFISVEGIPFMWGPALVEVRAWA